MIDVQFLFTFSHLYQKKSETFFPNHQNPWSFNALTVIHADVSFVIVILPRGSATGRGGVARGGVTRGGVAICRHLKLLRGQTKSDIVSMHRPNKKDTSTKTKLYSNNTKCDPFLCFTFFLVTLLMISESRKRVKHWVIHFLRFLNPLIFSTQEPFSMGFQRRLRQEFTLGEQNKKRMNKKVENGRLLCELTRLEILSQKISFFLARSFHAVRTSSLQVQTLFSWKKRRPHTQLAMSLFEGSEGWKENMTASLYIFLAHVSSLSWRRKQFSNVTHTKEGITKKKRIFGVLNANELLHT